MDASAESTRRSSGVFPDHALPVQDLASGQTIDEPFPRYDLCVVSIAAKESAAAPVVDVSDLRMRYGTKDVLLGESFRVHSGEVVALLGPNGAGKTTTIEILEGFRMRSAGEVSVLGTDPGHGDERWRAKLGIVLQSWRDHAKWQVTELLTHIAAYYAPYASPDEPRPRDVGDLIATVGLTGTRARRSRNCPVDSGAASTSRSESSVLRTSCSWTSRPQASTRRRVSSSTRWSAGWR